MSKLDGSGRDHEEFKLRLNKDKEVQLAQISIDKDIADAQAQVLSEALKSAKIDIIGGESMFFEKITGSIAKGKAIDGMVGKSQVLSDVKNVFFQPNGGTDFKSQLKTFLDQFGMTSGDIRNMTISAVLLKMMTLAGDQQLKTNITALDELAKSIGISDKNVDVLGY